MTLTPERIADLVKELNGHFANDGALGWTVVTEIEHLRKSHALLHKIADALSTPPPAEGVTGMRIAEIKARLTAATDGPWVRNGVRCRLGDEDCITAGPQKFWIIASPIGHTDKEHAQALRDMEFIAHAPQDISDLLHALEAALATKPIAGVDWEARFNAHTKAVHDWLAELAATIGAVDDMADDGATTVEVIKTEIMRRAREDRERWHSQPIAAPDEALRPISEAPRDGTEILVAVAYRYQPYKPDGQRQMKSSGRWQIMGKFGWENAPEPEQFIDMSRVRPTSTEQDAVIEQIARWHESAAENCTDAKVATFHKGSAGLIRSLFAQSPAAPRMVEDAEMRAQLTELLKVDPEKLFGPWAYHRVLAFGRALQERMK